MALQALPTSVTQGGRRILIESQDVASIVEICQQFGVKVSSGYRTATENALAGGAPHSDHLAGTAADFVGSPAAMSRLHAWASAQGFPYVEPMSQSVNHVHISFQRSAAVAGPAPAPTPPRTRPGGGILGSLTGAIEGPLEWYRFLVGLLDPHNWLRAVELLVGAGLLGVALIGYFMLFTKREPDVSGIRRAGVRFVT